VNGNTRKSFKIHHRAPAYLTLGHNDICVALKGLGSDATDDVCTFQISVWNL
jgi:hypothetical protein